MIEKRHKTDTSGDTSNKLSTLAIRGIKAYAEKAILIEKSGSKWLMGNGSPTPYELMTGFWASRAEMKDQSIRLMEKMVLEHERFVYVQGSARNNTLWTFGNALKPFEYLVIDTMEDNLTRMVDLGGTRNKFRESYQNFAKEIGSKIAYGVFRVSQYSEPHIFYCHVDHVQVGALIAISDAVFQMHRGSPMLLDLANHLCQNAFGKNDLIASIEQASAKAEVKIKMNTH